MLVKNVGNAPVLICDYNGKRYAFHRGIPVEITPEIYNSIVQSGHITATEIMPVEAVVIEEKPKAPDMVEKVVETVKKPFKKGRGR